MYRKTFALTVRALRVDARGNMPHLLRLGLAAVVLLNLLYIQNAYWTQAPGLSVFSWIIYSNVVFATVAVPLLFGNAITEEKEERTLALLRVADVGPLTIVAGKALPRLLGMLLILVVQVPFALLAVTLGGVTLSQIFAAYLSLAAYLLFVGCLSIFCSVILKTSANAVGLAGLLVLGYHVLPPMFYGIASLYQNAPAVSGAAQLVIRATSWMMDVNIFVRLNLILTSGFDEGSMSAQFVTNLAAAAVFFLLAWGSFEPFNRNIDAAPIASRRSRKRDPNQPQRRVWSAALMWKEFYHAAGGKQYVIAKAIAYGSVILLVVGASYDWRLASVERKALGMTSAWLMFFCFLPLEITLTVARTLHSEVREKTLANLLLLPMSLRELAYSKFAGGFLGLAPACGYLLLGTLLAPESFTWIWRDNRSDLLSGLLVFLNVAAQLLLFWHLVVSFSLSMSTWWAIAAAAVLQYFTMSIIAIVFSLVLMGLNLHWVMNERMGYFLGALAALGVFTVTLALHWQIGRQLLKKGTES